MRLAKLAIGVMAAALLLPSAGVAAQEDSAASPAPPPPAASPDTGPATAEDVLLALIPVEAAGLALREQATTFSAAEMRANSAEDERLVLDALISAAGEPSEGLGVAAVLATTADGAGGILVQAISVPGMAPEDGIAFWTSMLDLANETAASEQVHIEGKTATRYLSSADPDITAYLYSVDGAAWLVIASDEDMLGDLFAQLP